MTTTKPSLAHVASRRRAHVRVSSLRVRVATAEASLAQYADMPAVSRLDKRDVLASLGRAALYAVQAYRDSHAGSDEECDALALCVDLADRASFEGFGWR